MDILHCQMDSPRPYCKDQFRERDGEEDKGRNGQITSLSRPEELLHNPGPWPQPTQVDPVGEVFIQACRALTIREDHWINKQ